MCTVMFEKPKLHVVFGSRQRMDIRLFNMHVLSYNVEMFLHRSYFGLYSMSQISTGLYVLQHELHDSTDLYFYVGLAI